VVVHKTFLGSAACQDSFGKHLFAWTEKLPSGDPWLGEARVALLAIRQAMTEGLSNIILEGNSQVVVSTFLNQDLPNE
jgi:hypothetical protein